MESYDVIANQPVVIDNVSKNESVWDPSRFQLFWLPVIRYVTMKIKMPQNHPKAISLDRALEN